METRNMLCATYYKTWHNVYVIKNVIHNNADNAHQESSVIIHAWKITFKNKSNNTFFGKYYILTKAKSNEPHLLCQTI